MTSAAPRRRSSALADGRSITFYDDRATVEPILADHRDLPTTDDGSELRYDPVLDVWVIVATHRQTRTHLPSRSDCPLCPTRNGLASEIPAADFDVVVFDNRFSSLRAAPHTADVPGPYAAKPASGACEVVVFTSDHDASFGDLPQTRIRTIIDAWAERTEILMQRADVTEVFCFENRGEEIGVTLPHPHGQIYGYPFATPTARTMLASTARHHEQTGRNLFADVLAAEIADGSRIVTHGRHWTAFVPAAARWPFEIHLYPQRTLRLLGELTGPERDELAVIYPEILRRLDDVFGIPMPYVAAWHQAPKGPDRELAFLHLRVHSTRRAPDRLKHPAGSEAAMGVFINDIAPEHAAAMLRGAG